MIVAKFDPDWPSGFRWEDFWKSLWRWTDEDYGRQVMAISLHGPLVQLSLKSQLNTARPKCFSIYVY